jgi:hypothetical protein
MLNSVFNRTIIKHIGIITLTIVCSFSAAAAIEQDDIHTVNRPSEISTESLKPWIRQGQSNMEANPNNIQWKFSQNGDFEHIKWGKNLADKQITATIIGPCFAYRDIVELCQRFDLKVNRVMTGNFSRIPDDKTHYYKFPDVGDSPEHWNKLVNAELDKPADVIIIGKVQWNAFSVEQKNKIINKVQAGCGLLYINPELTFKNNKAYMDLWIDAKEKTKPVTTKMNHLIELKKINSKHYSVQSLKNLKLPQLDGKDFKDIIYEGAFGKGRVLAIDFTFKINHKLSGKANDLNLKYKTYMYNSSMGIYHFRHCLLPSYNSALLPCSYEYLMSCLAKCIRWCSRRDPSGKITDISLKNNQLTVAVSKHKKNTDIVYEIRNSEGMTGRVIQKGKINTLPINIAAPDSTRSFINIWLNDRNGKVIDWGTLSIINNGTINKKTYINNITISPVAPAKGSPVTGMIKLTHPLSSDEDLKLYAVDNFNRILCKQIFKSPQKSPLFHLDFDSGRSVSVNLIAERLKNGNIQEKKSEIVVFSTKKLDCDFAFVMWAFFTYHDRQYIQDLAICQRLGINAMQYTAPSFFNNVLNANMRLVKQVARITDRQVGGFSDPAKVQQWYKLYRKAALKLEPYAPLAITEGDEAHFAHGKDGAAVTSKFAHSAYSDEDFRFFLCDYFGMNRLNLKKINQLLGTEFKDINEIKVKSIIELRKEKNCPQWVLEAIWADWMYRRILRTGVNAVKSVLPDTYCGDEGIMSSPYSGYGHDFYQDRFSKDIYQMYYEGAGRFMVKSFGPQKSLRGSFAGNYGYMGGEMDEEWMRSFPWRLLFFDMNSVWWWMLEFSVTCDGKPIPCLEQLSEEVKRIKHGYATLLLNAADPVAPVVGVLYSPNTIHVDTFYKQKPARPYHGKHKGSLTKACEALSAAGIPSQILHQSQLNNLNELNKGYRALILPAVSTYSLKQLKTIKEFVRNGGILFADEFPERLYNELGIAYKENPFMKFLKKTGDHEYAFGKGKALLVKEPFSLSHTYRYEDDYGKTFSEKQKKPLSLIFREFIKTQANYTPPASFKYFSNGQYEKYAEINFFQNDSALYIGIDRIGRYWEGNKFRWLQWDDYVEDADFDLLLESPAHLYDSLNGNYLGHGTSFKLRINSMPRLLSALSCKIDAVQLLGLKSDYIPGETVRGTIKVNHKDGNKNFSSVVNLSVKRKDGKELPCFLRNMIVNQSNGEFTLPLALNEEEGDYLITAKDTASGVSITKEFHIAPKEEGNFLMKILNW